jgi:hypothetical protein
MGWDIARVEYEIANYQKVHRKISPKAREMHYQLRCEQNQAGWLKHPLKALKNPAMVQEESCNRGG